MFPMNNLSNLQALRMSVFGTPHGPFQNPGSPNMGMSQAMPAQHPMLPAPNLTAGPWGGMPPGVSTLPPAAAPVQGTMATAPVAAPMGMPARGTAMPAPQFPQLNALQSLAPQPLAQSNLMRRGPMAY